MKHETILTNAHLVLEDEVIHGTIVLKDGVIRDIDETISTIGVDMGGNTLIPGLVELHTDHLESHFMPRPTVRWNHHAAIIAHDAQIASSGITTVLDALRVGADENAEFDGDETRKLADVIEESNDNGCLRAEHFLHLRCEVSAPDCLDGFARFDGDTRVKLASLMDHAPGQRQFVSLEAYKIYYMGKRKMGEAEFELFCERRIAESQENSAPNRSAVSKACFERGIMLASHDDATMAHVDEALEQGIAVAEFPTTEEAAKASHEGGLAVLMGAPNLMRGGSHSGNVSAQSLAENGHLDILSSDYIPFSLISSAFKLSELVDDISLPKAINLVSRNPAQAIGLDDRGILKVGKRADIVRVSRDYAVPVVRSVWRQGERVV